jgi:hypothetical protein
MNRECIATVIQPITYTITIPMFNPAGDVLLGDWQLQEDSRFQCCGETVYENRTCREQSTGTCQGLHLKRAFPCNVTYPVTCGAGKN